MANEYLKSGRYETEKNDCTVIALSYGFNIDYSHAHKVCKEKGRKDGHRFDMTKVLGVKPSYEYFVFKSGDRRFAKYTYLFKGDRMTVNTFRKTHPTGTYLVRISGHVFTVIDGIIYNNKRDRCIVKSFWHVKKEMED
jgi:hypothetical protein